MLIWCCFLAPAPAATLMNSPTLISPATKDPAKLGQLQAALDENQLTLLAFDVVDLASIDQDFRQRILAEAKDITNI